MEEALTVRVELAFQNVLPQKHEEFLGFEGPLEIVAPVA